MSKIVDYYSVSFEVYGFDFPASQITEALHIEPTLTWTKGEGILHKKTKKVLRQAPDGRWSIQSNLPQGSEVGEQCLQLLNLLRPHKEYLLNILRTGGCLLEIGGYTYDEGGKVGVNLPSAIVAELSEYGAEIDIDIYVEEK